MTRSNSNRVGFANARFTRLRTELNEVALRFAQAVLSTANLMADIAFTCREAESRRQKTEITCRAYRTAVELLPHLRISAADSQSVYKQLDDLEAKLSVLGMSDSNCC